MQTVANATRAEKSFIDFITEKNHVLHSLFKSLLCGGQQDNLFECQLVGCVLSPKIILLPFTMEMSKYKISYRIMIENFTSVQLHWWRGNIVWGKV